ncbi:hypothetical protein HOY82DRAFT_550584 [Tuber indicum]|nr:hypothetical protein HOY82DRAFT_550584 [Tuber indicum]
MGYPASMTLFPSSKIIAFPNQTAPEPPSIWHLKLSYSPSKTDTHPNTRPTLSHAVDRYLITASFVFILAILVYPLRHPRYSHSINNFRLRLGCAEHLSRLNVSRVDVSGNGVFHGFRPAVSDLYTLFLPLAFYLEFVHILSFLVLHSCTSLC